MPVEVTVRLLKKAMEQSGKSRFLIDGFPRNANNVEVPCDGMRHVACL